MSLVEFMPSRRAFLLNSLRLVTAATLPDLPLPANDERLRCRPNGTAAMTNISVIPEKLFPHSPDEIISMSINFENMFNHSRPDPLNLGTEKGGNLWGYGNGVREALRRGQQVYLVIETPGKDSPGIASESWQKYVQGIASRWTGATFIVGNEVNAYQNNPWNAPKKYAELYLDAADIIRRFSPKSKILLYGEAYSGHGEVLVKVVSELYKKGQGAKLPVDGLAIHFYDRASLLPTRAKEYADLVKSLDLPPAFYLTELGKPEGVLLTEEEHSWSVTQNLATALSLVSQEKIKLACWYTAFQSPDPYRHNLIKLDGLNNLTSTLPFEQFWYVSKLLNHDVRMIKNDGVIFVTGKNSLGEETIITWKISAPGSMVEGKPTVSRNN